MVAQGQRISDEQRAAILEDIRAKNGSTRVIGARHGVSDASVRKITKDAGETDAFSREGTEKATRVRLTSRSPSCCCPAWGRTPCPTRSGGCRIRLSLARST